MYAVFVAFCFDMGEGPEVGFFVVYYCFHFFLVIVLFNVMNLQFFNVVIVIIIKLNDKN